MFCSLLAQWHWHLRSFPSTFTLKTNNSSTSPQSSDHVDTLWFRVAKPPFFQIELDSLDLSAILWEYMRRSPGSEVLFQPHCSSLCAVLTLIVIVKRIPFYSAIKLMAATQIKPSTNMTGPVPGHGWPRRGGGPAPQTPTQFNESKYPATSAMTINRPINL